MKYEGHSPLPYRIEDVCGMLGIKTRNGKCPICGGRTSFGVSISNQVCHCMKCGFSGNATTLYAKVKGVSTKDAYSDLVKALDAGFTPLPKKPGEPVESDAPIADLRVRNKTYSHMFSLLSLSEQHVEDLKNRGFDEENLKRYRTLSIKEPENRISLARKLISEGCELSGVPGFYIDKDGNWTIKYTKTGILVPYVSFDRKIQGLQIRKDNRVLKTYEDGKKENKYTWLSSNLIPEDAKPGSGTGAKTFVHYACDFEKSFDGSYRPVFLNHTAFLTEGAMKADLAHMFTGQGYVAVPGVNALLQLGEEFKKLRKLGVSRIINAYDMDYLTNPHVFKAVKKTEEMIHEMGFSYNRLMWDTKEKELGKALKGIDDYYAYCYKGIVLGKDIKENA